MRVLVVWEPILVTDWKSPGSSALARISDRRVRQFWDPKHLVAQELARMANDKPRQLRPDCCVKKGFHWDEVVLYAPHARWGDEPSPAYWDGPVYKIAPALEQALNTQP